jgi:hypothetical protein
VWVPETRALLVGVFLGACVWGNETRFRLGKLGLSPRLLEVQREHEEERGDARQERELDDQADREGAPALELN